MIEGHKYWLKGWVKDGEKGKFLSFSDPAEKHSNPKLKPAAVDDEEAIPL